MLEKIDEEIARQVQRGDVESFGLLIERYEQKLMRYAKKFIIGREDGKDLVQEVFIKAYVNIQSFDSAKKFSSWIYRIAHNEFINAIKKRSRTSIFSFDSDIIFPQPTAPQTADGEAEKKELKQILDRSLGKLDSKYREPLVLYYFEDMDYREIAEVLQIPISTVGVRLRRGKTLLKKMIK
jgi:RNA polymerase sigma-70 factor (ECF subfamily)